MVALLLPLQAMSAPGCSSQSEQPPTKRKKLGSSAVHKEFTKGLGSGKYTGKEGCFCNHCSSFFTSKNPTTLKHHLLTFHGEVYEKVKGKFNFARRSNSLNFHVFKIKSVLELGLIIFNQSLMII